ncbi:hypothetical protein HDU99_005088 [Rhizoclosmatium hyalinum]|nr:hypothetical protein HDU99_005088 [Rhizoclosmatium hyalinum]
MDNVETDAPDLLHTLDSSKCSDGSCYQTVPQQNAFVTLFGATGDVSDDITDSSVSLVTPEEQIDTALESIPSEVNGTFWTFSLLPQPLTFLCVRRSH